MSRYNVWYGETPSQTDYLADFLFPQNLRKEDKSAGAGSFYYRGIPDVTFRPTDETAEASEEDGTFLDVPRNWVIRVEDSERPGEDKYERTIWCGFVVDKIYEPYSMSKWRQGTFVCEEIGKYYDQFVIDPRWIYEDENGRFLNEPPDFNPFILGKYWANRGENNKFLTSGFPNEADTWSEILNSSGFYISETIKEAVWSINDIIELVVDNIPNLSYTKITDPEEEGYIEYINDKETPKTYESVENKSLSEILDDLLPYPLCWRLKYDTNRISQGVVELVIESESMLNFPQIPKATRWLQHTLRGTKNDILDHGVQSISINDNYIPVDQLIVRSREGILVAGSMTPWSALGNNVLDPDWTDAEQEAFVNGIDLDATGRPVEAQEEYRKQLPNVYQRFAFKSDADDSPAIIYRTLYPGSTRGPFTFTFPSLEGPKEEQSPDITEKFSFFPLFQFTDADGEYLDEPIPLYRVEENPTHYSTPNLLAIEWDSELPIYEFHRFFVNGENGTSKNGLRMKPMVLAAVKPDQLSDFFWVDLLDTTFETKSQLDFHPNGFIVETTYPQLFAWSDQTDGIFRGEDEIVYRDQVDSEWAGAGNNNGINPDNVINGQGPFKGSTHWSRFIFTLAGRSDQKLEYIKTREILEGYDDNSQPIFTPVEVKKRMVVETDHEAWWVAGGTVVGTVDGENGTYDNLERVEADTWTRNELPELKNYADIVFEWVTRERFGMTIEYQMNLYDWTINNGLDRLEPNSFYNVIIDRDNLENVEQTKSQQYTTNSVVKSVEWIFNEDEPVIIVQTEQPDNVNFGNLLGDNNAN